jgi:hypothetical protein
MDPRRKVSQAQEKGVAQRYAAKQHAGSGSGSKPQDMHTDSLLIECKTVLPETLIGKGSITIKAADWKQLRYNAAIQDKSPVLHIELGKYRLVLIPEEDHRAESMD